MAREEPLEHGTKQECAPALKGQFVDGDRDLNAATKAQRSGHREACHDRRAVDRTYAFNLAPHTCIVRARIKLQQLA